MKPDTLMISSSDSARYSTVGGRDKIFEIFTIKFYRQLYVNVLEVWVVFITFEIFIYMYNCSKFYCNRSIITFSVSSNCQRKKPKNY